MYFRVNYRWADETTSHVRADLQAKLFADQMMGSLDDNIDGKVQLAELKAGVRTPRPPCGTARACNRSTCGTLGGRRWDRRSPADSSRRRSPHPQHR